MSRKPDPYGRDATRPDHIPLKGWWQVVNWEEAASRFEHSDTRAEDSWESEGGSLLKATA